MLVKFYEVRFVAMWTGLAHARVTPKASQRLELETGHADKTERSEGLGAEWDSHWLVEAVGFDRLN